MGATAQAFDISLRVWYNDRSTLRLRGDVALRCNLATGEYRIDYEGEQLAFAAGHRLGCRISSSLVLPNPTTWTIPKPGKVAGEHTRGRVLVIGFHGVMLEKLQIVFRITDDGNDHGKFFIKTLESIRRAAVQAAVQAAAQAAAH
jgi:hypothetical protein